MRYLARLDSEQLELKCDLGGMTVWMVQTVHVCVECALISKEADSVL